MDSTGESHPEVPQQDCEAESNFNIAFNMAGEEDGSIAPLQTGQEDNPQQKEEEKSPPCLVLQEEEEETQVFHKRIYLEEAAWKLFQKYEKKLHTTRFIGDLQREKLKESFHQLHQYLAKKEEACIAEKKDIEASHKDLEARVRVLLGFSSTITNVLEKLENGEMEITTEQLKILRDHLEEVSKFRMEHKSHLSPFQVQEWRGILHIVKPVSKSLHFYPNSAHPNIFISHNCKQVRYTFIPQARCINAYFEPGLYVLGLPGFNTGQHYWEVDVGHKSNWILGIVKDTVQRKVAHNLSINNGFWVLRKQEDNVYHGCDLSTLKLMTSPIRIGVFVQVSSGHIAFYNADTTEVIFEMSGCLFAGYLFPFFCPGVPVKEGDLAPLSLC